MRKLLFTQQGNQRLSITFWLLFIFLWGGLHLVQWYPTQFMSLNQGCVILQTTGFSCWSCGLTRMCNSLIQFQLLEAFRYNPFFMIVFVLILIYCIRFTVHAFRKRYTPPALKFRVWYVVVLIATLVGFTMLRNSDFYLQFFYV